MNPADIATRNLDPLQLVGIALEAWVRVYLKLLHQIICRGKFDSYNISGISNNGMLCTSSHIGNTSKKLSKLVFIVTCVYLKALLSITIW